MTVTGKSAEETQIRIILDRGKSIACPLCREQLDAGHGHLCRESSDGVLSGQTWRLSGGQIYTKKEEPAHER